MATDQDAGPGASAVEYRVERPEAGSGRRGLISVPAWLLWSVAGSVGASGALLMLRSARKRRRP